MMEINNNLFEELISQAEKSPRLRQSYDLRTSAEDQSQRILNAVLPGTQVSIHRHKESTECVLILKGKIEEIFYNEKGIEYERFTLDASSDIKGCKCLKVSGIQ